MACQRGLDPSLASRRARYALALLVQAGADVDLVVEHVDRARWLSIEGSKPRWTSDAGTASAWPSAHDGDTLCNSRMRLQSVPHHSRAPGDRGVLERWILYGVHGGGATRLG